MKDKSKNKTFWGNIKIGDIKEIKRGNFTYILHRSSERIGYKIFKTNDGKVRRLNIDRIKDGLEDVSMILPDAGEGLEKFLQAKGMAKANYLETESYQPSPQPNTKEQQEVQTSNHDPEELAGRVLQLPAERRELLLRMISQDETFMSAIHAIERSKSAEEFEALINDSQKKEKDFQNFMEAEQNHWILGNRINFVFTRYEESQSKTNDSGKQKIIDLRMSNLSGFSTVVEIKTPSTKLTKQVDGKNYKTSTELTEAVDQALNYHNAGVRNSNTKGQPEYLSNAQTLLVIGKINNLNEKERECFELYRNNSKSVVIITYDELLERAKSIVDNKTQQQPSQTKAPITQLEPPSNRKTL